MPISDSRTKRRFTIVELLLALTVAGIVAAIVSAIVLGSEDPAQTLHLTQVQEGVRRFQAETGSYPTYGATPAPGQTPVAIWVAGHLPSAESVPAYAGIDFGAKAAKTGQPSPVALAPDYVKEQPRHAGEAAQDGTKRWRIDKDGTVSIELDGRSY